LAHGHKFDPELGAEVRERAKQLEFLIKRIREFDITRKAVAAQHAAL